MRRRDFVKELGLLSTTFTVIPGLFVWDSKARAQERYQYYFLEHPHKRWNDSFYSQVFRVLGGLDPIWQSRLVRLQQDRDIVEIKSILDQYGPNTIAIDGPMVVKVYEEFPGEAEVFEDRWLQYNARVLTEDCYPVSGGWWSVEGDWNPTWQKVRNHLFLSPNHEAGEFEDWYLDDLRFEELQSLHSDHHREMIGQGRVHWDLVNIQCGG